MDSREFETNIKNLIDIYEKLNDENKDKLEEVIQMVLTKFKQRI